MVKKRRVTSKPDKDKRPTADEWIQGGGVDAEIQSEPTPQPAPEPTRIVKSKSPDHQKATFYLTKALHKRLKAQAAIADIEMSDAAEEAIAAWLDAQSSQ